MRSPLLAWREPVQIAAGFTAAQRAPAPPAAAALATLGVFLELRVWARRKTPRAAGS